MHLLFPSRRGARLKLFGGVLVICALGCMGPTGGQLTDAGDQGGASGEGGEGGEGGEALGGSGGTASGGKGGAAGSGPTFTEIYTQIMGKTPSNPASSCNTNVCHGTGGNVDAVDMIDMSSQSRAYKSLQFNDLVSGGKQAKLYVALSTGKMPMGKPKLPAALIQLVLDWINAGAKDN